MGEWRRHKVQELIDADVLAVNDGYRAKRRELGSEGLPFARAGNIKAGFHFDDADRFPRADLEKVGHKASRPGDVVFTSKGTVGRFAFVRPETEPFVYSPQLCFWRSLDPDVIDPLWLFYWMQSSSFYEQYRGVSRQSDMAEYVNLRDQRRMFIEVPDIDAQREIGSQLSRFDRKIDLNHHLNTLLEQTAHAIFRSWFVTFDPVRAKVRALELGCDPERAAMGAVSGKLRVPSEVEELDASDFRAAEERLAELSADQQTDLAQTAALFPSAMMESEVGEVPEGWGVVQLKDLLSLNYGKALKKTDRVEGSVPVYGSGGLTGWHDAHLCEGPGIIVGRKGTVGSIYWEPRDFYPIDTVFWVEPHDEISLEFIYYSLQGLSLSSMNTDAAVPGLNRNNAYRLSVIAPHQNVVDRFTEIARSTMQSSSRNMAEIATLTTLRDTLLPRLISGELSVEGVAV